ALLLGGLAEFLDFLATPLRLDVTRRKDGDESGDPLQAVAQCDGKIVVALKLRVPPDPRVLAEKLGHTDLQRPVQAGDPSLAAFDQTNVVEVGVAYERIAFESHIVSQNSARFSRSETLTKVRAHLKR